MARKTREEALATREQLLDAAVQVFRERGVGHTTLGEVADAAGVTRGAIYWHFKSKADLFEAMVARAELPMDSALGDMQREALADPLGAIRMGALRALTHLADSPDMQAVFDVVFLRCEYTDELQVVEQRHLKDRADCLAQCAQTLDLAVQKGQLPPDTDTELVAQGLYAFIGGLMRDWVQAPVGRDLKQAAPALIDAFIAGLRINPPRRAARQPGAGRPTAGRPTAGRQIKPGKSIIGKDAPVPAAAKSASTRARKGNATSPARAPAPRRGRAVPAAQTRSARS